MILLYAAAFVGISFFLLKFGIRFASLLTKRMVERRFRTAETLVKEKRIPGWWIDKALGRRWEATPLSARNRTRARKRLIKLLDNLTKYFETCPLFDNEETRALMVSQLDEIFDGWKDMSLDEILESDYAPE